MLAMPRLASRYLNTLIRLIRMRAPEQPIGWPRATAPPWTFTVDGSRSSSFMFASATAEKASLTSWYWMSYIVMPDRVRSFSTALAGAMAKSIGVTAASS